MRTWCPRCDAVRPGQTSCPVCGTPLATLDDTAGAARQPDLPPPPAEEAAPPPAAPSRLRIALGAAILVLAGLAFVAGRSIARPPAPPAPAAAATSTTTPEPGTDFRELGWTARRGRLTVTAVEAERVALSPRETVARLTLRVQGLPPGQRLLALRGLRLLDSGGGVFASVDEDQLGDQHGVPVELDERQPGTYTVRTGPAPRLSLLARIELGDLLAVQPGNGAVTLDTAGPWPAGAPLRTVRLGARDGIRAGLGFTQLQGAEVLLRVTGAFVGGGQATVVVDTASGLVGGPGQVLPLTAELRAGDRVLCTRTTLLGEENTQSFGQGIVLTCPTRPVPRLTVTLGVGVAAVPVDAALRP